jgi:hypothetical protein
MQNDPSSKAIIVHLVKISSAIYTNMEVTFCLHNSHSNIQSPALISSFAKMYINIIPPTP